MIIGFYLISLGMPSYTGGGGVYGFFALFFGGLTIMFGLFMAFIAWSYNFLFFIALTQKKKYIRKRILSGLAIIFGMSALFVTELPIHEGATTSPVEIGIGFYFWISSYILLFIQSWIDSENQS